MTVIVAAITADHGVVMAADRQVSNGWQRQYHDAPKLWTAANLTLGASGNLRAAQILKHYVTWPRYRADEHADLEAWLVKTVVPAIRAGIPNHGIVKTTEGVESIDATLLLAGGDRIAEISSDGSIVIPPSGRAAIGSGYPEALGRLGDAGPWAEDDVIDAVRRAIITARGCSGPISVVNTKDLQIRTVDT